MSGVDQLGMSVPIFIRLPWATTRARSLPACWSLSVSVNNCWARLSSSRSSRRRLSRSSRSRFSLSRATCLSSARCRSLVSQISLSSSRRRSSALSCRSRISRSSARCSARSSASRVRRSVRSISLASRSAVFASFARLRSSVSVLLDFSWEVNNKRISAIPGADVGAGVEDALVDGGFDIRMTCCSQAPLPPVL